MAENINVTEKMFLSNEMARVYNTANMLASFQEFSIDYMKNYNLSRNFLYSERNKEDQAMTVSFDACENCKNVLWLMSREGMERLAVEILNSYYISGKICSFADFADDYLYNYGSAKEMLYNEQRKEEQAMNSFDGIENSCDVIRMMNVERRDHLATQIVNTYYTSGKICSFTDFASEYIENYKAASRAMKNSNFALGFGSEEPPTGRKTL